MKLLQTFLALALFSATTAGVVAHPSSKNNLRHNDDEAGDLPSRKLQDDISWGETIQTCKDSSAPYDTCGECVIRSLQLPPVELQKFPCGGGEKRGLALIQAAFTGCGEDGPDDETALAILNYLRALGEALGQDCSDFPSNGTPGGP